MSANEICIEEYAELIRKEATLEIVTSLVSKVATYDKEACKNSIEVLKAILCKEAEE